ncbi:MAG: FtsH protease activity modulator HflK [Gammaproteobacteria bacterium]|nr:FtsH protease activity modulator HflK [Gammaproteobacteria bacterium]
MAWNEPGGGGRDPWSGKGGDQGPPDLDELLRKMQQRLGGLFGGRRGSGDGEGSGPPGGVGGVGLGVVAGGALVVWLLSGIYIVEPAERGVELRFGAFREVTQPGPHWRWPYPIGDVVKVDVDQISSFGHRATMLTRDENIVEIDLRVQSRVQDPTDFLFQDRAPEKTLRDATETATREVVGKNVLDFIITEGRGAIADQIRAKMQELMSQYRTGLEVVGVNITAAKPPDQVKSAFDDAIKAREDNERMKNEAQAYANEVVPKARGAAARVVEDARAYRAKVVAESEGETNRFLALLAEYEKAPQVTRERLYLDAVQDVLSKPAKVLMDDKAGGGNVTYLPLDRLLAPQAPAAAAPRPAEATAPQLHMSPDDARIRDADRARRMR